MSFITPAALIMVIVGCKGQSVITPEQAMDAVRAFEGASSLQLECRPLEELAGGPEWARTKFYLVDETQDESAGWTVNAVTGEVTGVTYYGAHAQNRSDVPTGPLSQDECRQIAEGFTRSKHSGFDTMGLELREQEWTGEGWSFGWQQKVAYDAWTPNHVKVDVNAADGRIQSYGCTRVVTPTPQAPQITVQQAIDAVKADRGLTSVLCTESSMLFTTPDGTFWVLIDVQGEDTQGNLCICNARVDAITGAVVEISESLSSPSNAVPSVLGGNPVSVRELAARIPSTRVHWLGKDRARLFVGKNRYTLVPGKDTIEWTGGTIKLSAKIKLVDGRLMVPSGLIDVLKNAPVPRKAPTTPAKSK